MITVPGHRHSKPDERLQARNDASTFRLQQQFRQAHGAPTGELTTLVTSLVEGGVFVSSQQRGQ